MKKIALSLIGCMALYSNSFAAEKYEGYSYIGFGSETITYKEIGEKNGKKFLSSADVTSPVYTSGSLINGGNYFDFSIDAASTLTPAQTEEKWQYDGYVTQKNKFDAVLSDLRILVHYKLNNNHRFVFGPSYEMFSMKRHTFTDPSGEAIPNTELNQETISTVNMTAGYWYEHAPFSNGGMRVKVSALYGQPVWRDATNTSAEEVAFDSTSGTFVNWNGYVGFELTKGLEFGIFADYSFTKKEGGDDALNADGDEITWPENELETFRYGLSLVWNFSVK